MNFYFTDYHGKGKRRLKMEEVRRQLSPAQIEEALQSKKEDPHEEVSYMTTDGFIICE